MQEFLVLTGGSSYANIDDATATSLQTCVCIPHDTAVAAFKWGANNRKKHGGKHEAADYFIYCESATALLPLQGLRAIVKVLVGCEFSGVVRDAFIARGHEAISCDILPSENDGPHYQGDLFDIIDYPFDLAIFHPPCTHLAVSGAKHFEAKRKDGRQQVGMAFIMRIVRRAEHIPHWAIENPVSIISSVWRRPDQIVQPWQFGHGETKSTCLWLKNLPLLKPTNIVEGRENRIFRMPPSGDRWTLKSQTFQGIADAMADQWTGELL